MFWTRNTICYATDDDTAGRSGGETPPRTSEDELDRHCYGGPLHVRAPQHKQLHT